MIGKCKYNTNLLRIAKEINATEVISRVVAFQPPKKSLYKIEPLDITSCDFKTKQKHCGCWEEVRFIHDIYHNIEYNWINQSCYTFKNTKEGSKNKDKKIVILHIKNKNKIQGGYTILFSHGNASTLGTIYPLLIDICTQLKCDIIAYDYSGYGLSGGKPSEKEIYHDIEEVGYFVKDILQISQLNLILLGQSLGSAPSVHLAINKHFRDVKAVILISPIASGVKLVSPDLKVEDLDKIDVFCNIRKVVDISCPIFLVHGHRDEVIPIEQSIEMAKFIKNSYEWHPRHGDHSNIFTKYRTKFFQKCKFFFDYISYHNKQRVSSNSYYSNNLVTYPIDKFYKEVMNKEIQVKESWYGNGENNKFNESIKYSNGITHPFSAKNKFQFIEESFENNFEKVETIQNLKIHNLSNKNIDKNKIDLNLQSKESLINLNNNHRNSKSTQQLDLVSEDCTFSSNRLSGEIFINRNSNGSDMYYKDNQDLENKFHNMLIKHNGI